MRLFAGDCLIYRIIISPDHCLELQKDLTLLCHWESKWQMDLNKSRCYVLHMSHNRQPTRTIYHLQDTPLETSTIQKYLGVDLSTDLD